jgi:hypothetical protein
MARDSDHLAGSFETENTGGFLTGLLAEEDEFDRRSLWRLGSWGAGSVGAVIVALFASQSSIGLHREQLASAEVTRQSQQIQLNARESQDEARRLASAIETLNGDRDRLYARVTVLEQGLDSVTGAIARQTSAPAWPQAPAAAVTELPSMPQNPAPAPVLSPPPVPSPVAATPAATAERPPPEAAAVKEQAPAKNASAASAAASVPAAATSAPLMAQTSILAPPDAAAGKLIKSDTPTGPFAASPMPEVLASVHNAGEPEPEPPWAASASRVAVQQTEFGVDVGGANSLGGLRALWRGLLKSNNLALSTLRPIIVVKESNNGLGMQLRLVAGPLVDAAAAAKICAALLESQRACETTLFDGQRLAMKADEPPASVKPAPRKRSGTKRGVIEELPKKPETSTLSSLLGRR